MVKQIIALIAVVILVVLSGIQLVQISSIKDNFVTNGILIGENAAQKNTQEIAPQQVPSSSMVGGC